MKAVPMAASRRLSDIAEELGLSQRAVEGRLYRLRNRLRQELGGDDT